jgi:adenosylhomocysteinase
LNPVPSPAQAGVGGVKNHHSLDNKVYAVPEQLDRQVARLKLEAMGINIDWLSAEQENYIAGWSEET